MRLALALALSLVSTLAHAGACPGMPYLAPTVFPVGPIPASGAIVAVLQSSFGDHPKGEPWDVHPVLRRDQDKILLKVEVIGPGIARFVPAKPPAAGEWLVDGLAQEASVTFAATPAPAAPNAPKLQSAKVVARTSKDPIHGSTSSYRTVNLSVADKDLTGLVGAVVSDDHNVPFLFVPLDPDTKQLGLVLGASRCGAAPAGVEPQGGQKVSISWVDSSGRVSPASKQVAVIVEP